ncbi:hypothetical protein EC957_001114 [Mortierella hygrophila]|uniref:Uncharacterized protein n=1 Tax=Mortierella hygrophila TaxID=979708 RepID=A0A9P6K7Q5_9FUNG|nr:hypothetical protein EC957_001114 [Mortierella hygrophila]
MILKPLSSLILVLTLAAASPVHAAVVEPSVATAAVAAPSTADLGPSRSTPMANAITPAAVNSFASSQVSSHPNSKDPTGPSSMRKVSGWPSSLKIEIDELEIGGLAVPFVQTSLRNSKSGFKNFGNADLVSPNSGPDAEARSSGAENEQAGQVVEYA